MLQHMKVAALTSGWLIPSARFRIRQHIPGLKELGIEVSEYTPFISQIARLPGLLGRIRMRYLPPIAMAQLSLNALARIPGTIGTFTADLTWIERRYLPGMEVAAFCTKSPRILDVDDAIWCEGLFGKSSAVILAKSVDIVIAGNSYIANWFSQYRSKIYVVPTAVECNRFSPQGDAQPRAERQMFTVGWTGSQSNLHFLELVGKPLAQFFKERPNSCLRIISDREPVLASVSPSNIEYFPWSAESESSLLQGVDVGIMPLSDSDWTRGKCSFKMLQYMATGIPSIVSPIGMNNEILALGRCGLPANTEQEWLNALLYIHDNRQDAEKIGGIAREIAIKYYNTSVIANRLAEIFRSAAHKS